ncbi:MAG TPA: DmsC/YnfH family molybdoenzyme membrane anchor subunit [Terracidiphilus sp.]|nr:DmsC/YnfH family molybdoenzyme membrane anchor subunit [Terracidiphilus sp.]
MELPLLTRAQAGDNDAYRLTTAASPADAVIASLCGAGLDVPLPSPPGPGEQYRFHFDMTKCIGCKCCVVACNEQNGNPADILWRRVGEIEGGVYPDTLRHYLSMGCNHCLEPTCMTGCPVDAYTKDEVTGIVRHSADACIGCQYCTWNCSYGVPQYNPERGVVGKCDMCYGRLTQGQHPACVSACPEGAIRIEIVHTTTWREEYQTGANSPGMPSADDSISTTRITLPARMPRDVRKVDLNRLRPEQPHLPLIVMTVLTQLSVGGFTSIWLLELFSARLHRQAALVALLVAALALSASTLHLGRPIHAVRALKMWRRSWLSREVLMFTLFAAAAAAYSVALWMNLHAVVFLGGLTALLGIAGVGASAKLYLVPGRPAWNSPFTILEFYLTAALLGSAGANILSGTSAWAQSATIFAGIATLLIGGLKIVWMAQSSVHELRGTFRLLFTVLGNRLLLRFLLLSTALLLLPFAHSSWVAVLIALMLIAGEFMSRYLFFVSVVPTNIATEYLSAEAA